MSLKLAVAIATAGRRDTIAATLGLLARQRRPPDELLICPARPEDFDAACLRGFPAPARVLPGPVGLPAQRNVLLDAVDADVVIFFDDDFLPADDYLLEAERLFATRPGIVVATGRVVADGAVGPGIEFEEGARILEALGGNTAPEETRPTYNGYGCNMAMRMQPIRVRQLRFDERLPLYAWLEDVDFSRQLAAYGDIVQAMRLRGVHLGTKRSGRSPGRRLGYSQIANPLYLARKGTMAWGKAMSHMGRNLLANAWHSISPEPWVDRRGRLAGNALALLDALCGQMMPERVAHL
ncbi:MAG: glycosyltransferase [Xenophilus sp.]